ncbi:unnamed protein product [Urochloa decumbens]|uniref:Receptor kinase-like protein Xa21 n=1 Tax=Urochloa decumbens TaxID=240449 RepID=A0ABC8ZB15_9POAL
MVSLPFILLLFAVLQAPSSSLHSKSGDREALLQFKEGLSDPLGSLSSWNNSNADFCRWAGVTCSRRHPGRVVALSLPSRGLGGTISPTIGNLTTLRKLDLGSNMFSGEVPHTIGQLHRLRELVIENCSLDGEIPQELGNCSNLKVLSLATNQLQGRIPDALGSASRLQYLYLTYNNLVGGIPPSIGNLSLLVLLSFYQNNMDGTIPEVLSHLNHLQHIQVARNNFSGTIPPLFFNISSLQILGFGSNKLQGSIPPDAGANLPILKELHLGNNRLSGMVPSSLANATDIEVLSLARNNFQGMVPSEIGKLCPRRVELGGNRLEAKDEEDWEFMRSFTNCTRLQLLDLNNNNIGGILPGYVANFSRQIQWLSMAGNKISGVIPPGIGNLASLVDLEFAGNNLQGVIPEDIGRLQNLMLLWLQENRLSGRIPFSFGNFTQMLTLALSHNQLDGSIPKRLGNLKRLTSLDLSYNRLTGVIPDEIFTLSSLTDFLSLSGNYLSGVLPPHAGSLKHVARLDISRNNLSGNIPEALSDCENLVYLTLDGNFLTGSIPKSLGNLKALSILNLSRNAFSSNIPRELGKITGLQQLYLAHNNLSGSIPLILGNLSSLIELDISYNHLDGEVPSLGVFANLTRLSVLGNDGLCGGIPELKLPSCYVKPHNKQRQQLLLIILLPVGLIVTSLFLLCSLLFLFKGKITVGKMKISSFQKIDEKYPRVSYNELFHATDGFAPANLIGAGKYGSVFKGNLSLSASSNDATVAIKVFNFHQSGSSRSFMAELEVLRQVKHRNLINIITSCSSIDSRGNDFHAIVFKFMPNYSLDKWLHPAADEQWHKLSFVQLLNIAVQVADALDYLHNNSQPSIIHCDMKPSNIILGSDWTAYVADFGISKLVGESMDRYMSNSGNSLGIRGTIGYVAPEYGEGGQVSAAGDSYSFGITLLEMFTGRAPTDDMFTEGLSLHLFADMAFPDKISEIIDPSLLQPFDNDARLDTALACITSAIRVGISCSKKAPLERMSMKNAAVELHRTRDSVLEEYFAR